MALGAYALCVGTREPLLPRTSIAPRYPNRLLGILQCFCSHTPTLLHDPQRTQCSNLKTHISWQPAPSLPIAAPSLHLIVPALRCGRTQHYQQFLHSQPRTLPGSLVLLISMRNISRRSVAANMHSQSPYHALQLPFPAFFDSPCCDPAHWASWGPFMQWFVVHIGRQSASECAGCGVCKVWRAHD